MCSRHSHPSVPPLDKPVTSGPFQAVTLQPWFFKPAGPVWLLWPHRVVAAWYLIWFAVGAVVLSLDLTLPFAGLSDFIYNALASMLVLLAVARVWGGVRAFVAFICVALLTGWVEGLGATTGFLFGTYTYTENFGPRIGVVPAAVPLAWWAILIPAVQIAALATRSLSKGPRWIVLVMLPSALAVLTDLPLETVAFHVREYWFWHDGGPWYGVPASNFVGWMLLSGAVAVLLLAMGGDNVAERWETLGPWPLIALGLMHLSFAAGNFGNGFALPGTLALINFAWTAASLVWLLRQTRP